MIILLHGPDTLRSQKKRNELVAAYRGKYASGLSESFFSDADFSFGAFEEHVRGQALFSAKRLVVLANISQNKTALRNIESYLQKNDVASSRDVFIIFWESEDMQKVKEAAFLIQVASPVQLFSLLRGNAYRAWLSQTSAAAGAHFAPSALELFTSWHEGDSWRSVCDIQKLHAYANGQTIQATDVERLCVRPVASSVFTTLDLLFNKGYSTPFLGRRSLGSKQQNVVCSAHSLDNKKIAEAFAALETHIQSGDEVFYLFKMFSYQLRLIALIKEKLDVEGHAASSPKTSARFSSALSIAGVHPYAIRKTMPLAHRISWEKLNKLFSLLFQSDEAIKQGTADAVLCLEMFAYDVACT